ncbi:MAG: 16S rRNA processing protein RimM [Mucilaginibacter polytrichastri]|nr:16S rRNA processing protein RimM [Mucilaginibacter polytrichastri]
MLLKDAFAVGAIVKTKGLKGEMLVHLLVDYAAGLDTSTFFIEINGKLVPHFTRSFSFPKPGTAYLQLEDIDHIDQAQKLVKKTLYLSNEQLPENDGEFTFADLEGFIAHDKSRGEIGEIIRVEEFPQQWIATLYTANREVLVPLNEDFIEEIDEKKGLIRFDLPEGLIDIYLAPEKEG